MSMLTIKHIEKDGYESLMQAHGVSFYPRGRDGDEPPGRPRLDAFGCTSPDGGPVKDGCCSYGSGKVFVMNDAGSTVGNYDLS